MEVLDKIQKLKRKMKIFNVISNVNFIIATVYSALVVVAILIFGSFITSITFQSEDIILSFVMPCVIMLLPSILWVISKTFGRKASFYLESNQQEGLKYYLYSLTIHFIAECGYFLIFLLVPLPIFKYIAFGIVALDLFFWTWCLILAIDSYHNQK